MHQKLLDVTTKSFSLEEIINYYKIPLNEKKSISEEAYSIALLFLKLKSRLGFK